jgi:hypothetical protein
MWVWGCVGRKRKAEKLKAEMLGKVSVWVWGGVGKEREKLKTEMLKAESYG